jgi:hypothetical protein
MEVGFIGLGNMYASKRLQTDASEPGLHSHFLRV